MADVCMAMVQGVVPSFDNAVRSGNLEDENKAWCRIKLNVETSQQDESGRYKRKIIEVSAFRKQAITLARCAKAGTGFLLECDILESRPMTSGGEAVLDKNGRQVYGGQDLVVRPYGMHFQKNYDKPEGNGSGNAYLATAAATAEEEDPLKEFFGPDADQPAKQKPQPQAQGSTSFDGFDFM